MTPAFEGDYIYFEDVLRKADVPVGSNSCILSKYEALFTLLIRIYQS